MRLQYDRGTLLLLDTPPGWTADLDSGFVWDERVRAHRAPGSRYKKIVTMLQNDRGSLPLNDQVHVAEPKKLGSWAPISLRPYQETALELWENAGSQGIVVLPTGAGKTRLALAIAAKAGVATLCLVPTRALLEQWRQEISKFYSGPIGIQGDGSHGLEAVTISTYESAYRRIGEFGNRFGLLIVDECHHFGRGIRDEIMEASIAPLRLGLSATLPSAEDWIQRLGQLIGPPVFELSVSDLTGTYLADFDYYSLHVNLTPDEYFRYQLEISAYRKVHSEFRDSCPGGTYLDWIRFAARSPEGRNALQGFQRAKRILTAASKKMEMLGVLLNKHWGRKILIFTADTETAYRISREHLIMPITSEIGRKERELQLQAYREGKLKALVSCRVLNEGLDVPDAEIAIILGGTQGSREHIQRIGRILRPGHKKRALIYELVCRGTIEVRQAKTRSQSIAAPIPSAL